MAKEAHPCTPDLALVRQIILEELAGYPVQVYLFGSWARGHGCRTSDIDIALLAPQPLPAWLLSRIREKLGESPVPYEVDLIDLSQTDAAFRARVLQEGILWNAPKNASPSPDTP